MVARSTVVPLSSMHDVVSAIGQMDDEQYHRLLAAIGSQSFYFRESSLPVLAASIGITVPDLKNILDVLRFAFQRLGELSGDDERRLADIAEFVDSLQGYDDLAADSAVVKQRLAELLRPSDVHRSREKISRLEAGFLPDLTNISTFVDLRPNFDNDLNEIDGFLPVVTLNIQTNSSNPLIRSITLNLPLSSIEEVISSVERLNRKVTKIREEFQL